jgi:hypothetical protein
MIFANILANILNLAETVYFLLPDPDPAFLLKNLNSPIKKKLNNSFKFEHNVSKSSHKTVNTSGIVN